jgi:hypothetical protein
MPQLGQVPGRARDVELVTFRVVAGGAEPTSDAGGLFEQPIEALGCRQAPTWRVRSQFGQAEGQDGPGVFDREGVSCGKKGSAGLPGVRVKGCVR